MAAAAAEAGVASREILKMLISFNNSDVVKSRRDVLEFVAETVAGYVEDETPMSQSDALVLLQDAGLDDIDDEDLDGLTTTIEMLTSLDDGSNGNESDDEVDDGSCELCERMVSRTFHHLVPKETHNRYLSKKKLPENLAGQGECTRLWLNLHGINICRTCHSTIHHSESNAVLAEEYNTLDRLLGHSKIRAFAKYNSSRPCRVKFQTIQRR